MIIDWSSKSTAHLRLILESLLRYEGNAKTDREKRNVNRNINEIKKVLESRK